jgi:SAM-dependent methyltransferase
MTNDQNTDHFYLMPHPALIKFINLCREAGQGKILEMGCGDGRHLVKLAEEGFYVSGIDKSPAAAALAEKWLHEKGLEGDIVVGDFDDSVKDFVDKSFDGVIAINSLEYGKSGEIEKNLKQIQKLLKPEGHFLLVYRSRKSTITHPEKEMQLILRSELIDLVSKYFKIIEDSLDQDNNFVIIAERLAEKITDPK